MAYPNAAYPDGAARYAPGVSRAAECGNYIPADVFRERLLRLANEYELMQASFASLRREGGAALPRRGDGVSVCDEGTPRECEEGTPRGCEEDAPRECEEDAPWEWDFSMYEEGKPQAPCSLRGVRLQLRVDADEATPDIRVPELPLPGPSDLDTGEGQKESEQVTDRPGLLRTVSRSSSSFGSSLQRSQSGRSSSSLGSPSQGSASSRRQGKRSVIRAQGPQHDWRASPVTWLAHSNHLERFIGCVIVLHLVFLGVSTEIAISDARSGDAGKSHVSLQVMEACFLAIYALEVMIRMVAFGTAYFTDEDDRLSNFFDMALVLQGLLEQVIEAASIGAGNLSFLRGLRLLKNLKMLRVVRLMRSMGELRMLLFAVLGSLKSMAWAVLSLVTVLYMFALVLLQGLVLYLEASGDSHNNGVSEGIVAYWGDVPTSMLTLFMSSSGGIDWESAYDVLSHAGVLFQFVFLTYTTFFMFVITNAITSIFVEATLERAARDLFGRVQTELNKKQEYVKNLHVLFEELDEEKLGQLSLEDFERQVKDPKILGFLTSMDLTIRDVSRFFGVLSENGTKVVDLEQFVSSCTRMYGPAQAVDVEEILVRQSMMHETICDFKRLLKAERAATTYAKGAEYQKSNTSLAVLSALASEMDTAAESASIMRA